MWQHALNNIIHTGKMLSFEGRNSRVKVNEIQQSNNLLF